MFGLAPGASKLRSLTRHTRPACVHMVGRFVMVLSKGASGVCRGICVSSSVVGQSSCDELGVK